MFLRPELANLWCLRQLVLKILIWVQKGRFANIIANSNKLPAFGWWLFLFGALRLSLRFSFALRLHWGHGCSFLGLGCSLTLSTSCVFTGQVSRVEFFADCWGKFPKGLTKSRCWTFKGSEGRIGVKAELCKGMPCGELEQQVQYGSVIFVIK